MSPKLNISAYKNCITNPQLQPSTRPELSKKLGKPELRSFLSVGIITDLYLKDCLD
jgi:hypothetical protein